jgi:hypothetical protein
VLRNLLTVYATMLVGALLGALIGLVLEQLLGQRGWALLIGAAGMNAGAFWAAYRLADDRLPWPARRSGQDQADRPSSDRTESEPANPSV